MVGGGARDSSAGGIGGGGGGVAGLSGMSGDATSSRPRRAKMGGAAFVPLGGGSTSASFIRLTERTTEAFIGGEDTAVEDVRRTLLQVRQQYDSVHHEAEQKDAKLRGIREHLQSADRLSGQKAEEMSHLEEKQKAFEQQWQETWDRIVDTKTSRMVYEHMLARIQKEQAILKQKMLMMEDHLARKRRDVHRRVADSDRANAERVQVARALEALTEDAEAERHGCAEAKAIMDGEMERRREANKRKAKFEGWRHEVALDAANEAFNASAGRLRKLYAIEKLCGNSLQKITFEQVERSQNTEDGFQKIREVTGLTDVMDIVHKFLNREVEHEQLKDSVKQAEVRLEKLRQDFDAYKCATEGMTFEPLAAVPAAASAPAGVGNLTISPGEGGIFKELESAEQELQEAMQEHESARLRLARTTVQTEHMKRWAAKIGQLLAPLEEPVPVQQPTDLAAFFHRLEGSVEKFTERVAQQIKERKITHKALSQVAQREYNHQTKTINDPEFLRTNCRVPPNGDGPTRPASRQGGGEDDPSTAFLDDRDRFRKESEELVHKAHQEQQKRNRPKG